MTFTDEQQLLLEAIAETGTLGHATAALGLSQWGVRKWRDADAAYDAAVKQALHQASAAHGTVYDPHGEDDALEAVYEAPALSVPAELAGVSPLGTLMQELVHELQTNTFLYRRLKGWVRSMDRRPGGVLERLLEALKEG